MKRNWSKRLIAILLIVVLTATLVSFTGTLFASAEVGGYYSSITAKGGQALLGQLHDLITTTHTRYTSYNDCKNPSYVIQTDPGSNSSSVTEFYSQTDISKNWGGGDVGTWNREHVWCQSLSNGMWGTSGGGSDMHHIRPAESSLNSTRGNNKFGDTGKENPKYAKHTDDAIGGYLSGGVFEPLDQVKGDVARIVMYVYTHYNTYTNIGGTTNGSGGSFGDLDFTNVIAERTEEKAIALLLKWNELDPVDDLERTRNEAVYKIQGNRNPFIDNPNYANAIWGGGDITISKLTGMTISPESIELTVGQTNRFTLTAIPSDANAMSDWTSSDASVVTVSSQGIVTAVSEGTATITATSVNDSSIKATATVTVKASGGNVNPTPSGYVTINQSSFDMTPNYSFKNWSSGGIGGVAFIYGGNETYPISESSGMQFNVTKDSYYIASNVATPGAIKSVTVTMVEGKAVRLWKLLTSNTAYGEVQGKPTDGTDHGSLSVSDQGVTWTLDGCSDKFFALVCDEPTSKSAASYISSIVIEYETQTSVEIVPKSLDVTPNKLTMKQQNANLDALKNAIEVNVIYSDNSKKSTTSYSISGFDPLKTGNQTVTVTVGELSSEITVTIEKDVVVIPPDDTAVEEFISAVDAINDETKELQYSSLLNAINKYNALSSSQKNMQKVKEKYTVLNSAIQAYNNESDNLNALSNKAMENALGICVGICTALGAIMFALKRNIIG